MKALKLTMISALMFCPAFAGEFLPLRPGNTWTYREAATGQSFTVRIGNSQFFLHDRVYHVLIGYAQARLLVRMDERNQLVYFDEEKGVDVALISFAPFEGGWWEAPSRSCQQMGQTLERRAEHDGPAGPFSDVLQIRYRAVSCADAGVQSEQYAENIGMVRRVEDSIAGPRQFDLVYARIGNVFIDATPHARFAVSVDISPRSEFLAVTLRLQTNSPRPLKLTFPSGQEFEVLVRDEVGRVLWTWSAGQVFTLAEHGRQISGGWATTVLAPRSILPRDGDCTVEAWLTTGDASPRFSATTPVILPGMESGSQSAAAGLETFPKSRL